MRRRRASLAIAVAALAAWAGRASASDPEAAPLGPVALSELLAALRDPDNGCGDFGSKCHISEVNTAMGELFQYVERIDDATACTINGEAYDHLVVDAYQARSKSMNQMSFFFFGESIENTAPVDCSRSKAFAVRLSDGLIFSAPLLQQPQSSVSCFVDWDGLFDSLQLMSSGFTVVYAFRDLHTVPGTATNMQMLKVGGPIKTLAHYNANHLNAYRIETRENSDGASTSTSGFTTTVTVGRGRFTTECPLPSSITVKLGATCERQARFAGAVEDSRYAYRLDLTLAEIFDCGVSEPGNNFIQLPIHPVVTESNFDDADFNTLASATSYESPDALKDFCFGRDRHEAAPAEEAPLVCPSTRYRKRTIMNEQEANLLMQFVQTASAMETKTYKTVVRLLRHDVMPCNNEVSFAGRLRLIVQVLGDNEESLRKLKAGTADSLSLLELEDAFSAKLDGEEFAKWRPADEGSPNFGIERVRCNTNPHVIDSSTEACFALTWESCQKMTALNSLGSRCKFDYLGAVELSVETCRCPSEETTPECCDTAVLYSPVVPCTTASCQTTSLPLSWQSASESACNSCQLPCSIPSQYVDVTPSFDVNVSISCNDSPLLNLNSELEVSVKLENLRAKGDFTFFIQNITVALEDPNSGDSPSPILISHFARDVKAAFLTEDMSPYSTDAHFCRSESTEPDQEITRCVPFYSNFPEARFTPELQSALSGAPVGYATCPSILKRDTDSFFFSPRRWNFHNFDGVSAHLSVNVTVVLSRCATDGGSTLIALPQEHTLLSFQSLIVSGQKSTEIYNPNSGCEHTRRKLCKNNCAWMPGVFPSPCIDKSLLGLLACNQVVGKRNCKLASHCEFRRGECVDKPIAKTCSDFGLPRDCNRGRITVEPEPCMWAAKAQASTGQCYRTSAIAEWDCEEQSEKICRDKANRRCGFARWGVSDRAKSCRTLATLDCEALSVEGCRSAPDRCLYLESGSCVRSETMPCAELRPAECRRSKHCAFGAFGDQRSASCLSVSDIDCASLRPAECRSLTGVCGYGPWDDQGNSCRSLSAVVCQDLHKAQCRAAKGRCAARKTGCVSV